MKKILYISSLDPTRGPGAISMDHYEALKSYGYKIDFLTLLPVHNFPEFKYVLREKYKKLSFHQLRYKILKFFIKSKYYRDKGFFYRKENEPPVPFKKIKGVISRDYDMIIVFFWQGLLSFQTLMDLYNYIGKKPKVVLLCADYSPMTGGCHFFGNCSNYQSECGCCPMIQSSNRYDFTNWNNIFRQNIVREIKPFIGVNTYMRRFFERSTVIKAGARLITTSMTMNLDKFRRKNNTDFNKKYGIKEKDSFIMLFGCQNLHDPRKGMTYLVESLNLFYSKLTEEECTKILLISIGSDDKELLNKIKFKRHHLGYVAFDELPFVYSTANVFLSPSINDAGPSMVNQAIACGTPVVAFEIGSALDVVKDDKTGYTVPLKDIDAFADAIFKIYTMSAMDLKKLSDHCYKIAKQFQSYEAFASMIEYCFNH